ncbi:unnamed protein product [Arctia plantaginis]|uniref:CRAL-TRIO domain-containing protein n=1 Tax=Arctia plantaginis TaxID=874455 RepID=A0A8S0Z647_ARCPL|nr:unnamed protein product [Arctia plantaginis]CAB3228205.1 unnamed protein product [Arctia plantaginis]
MFTDLEFNYKITTEAMDKFCQNDIEKLRVWTQNLDKTKCVPRDLTDKQLVLFYNACYGDMANTKLCIEKYYQCRKDFPEFFNNRVFNADLKASAEVFEFSVLPEYSSKGYDIIYNRLNDDNVWKFNLINEIKLLLMTVDLCLTKRGPRPGLIFIFDLQIKFGHLLKMNPLIIRKLILYLQDALPVRMHAIHILNAEPILDKLMGLLKPFMNKKFFDKITFHNKNESLEKFYDIVPRSSLPPIYGGTLPNTQLLHKNCLEQLHSLEMYFKSEEEQRLVALST